MTWARRRQLIAYSIIGAAVFVLLAGIAFYFLHTPASCVDQKQNQDETGIDCGGSCSAVCSASAKPARVAFVVPLTPAPGRTDIIAYVNNPNADAYADDARMELELYSVNNVRSGGSTVTLDLPPLSTVPVFIANAGDGTADTAFLRFEDGSPLWVKTSQKLVAPMIDDILLTAQDSAPRITATLSNPTGRTLANVTVVATAFDAVGNVIAATQTFVTSVPSQGSVPIIFNWSAPFITPVARIDVLPVPAF